MKVKVEGSEQQNSDMGQSDATLKVQTARGIEESRVNSYSGLWREVWKGTWQDKNVMRFPIHTAKIPTGTLRFSWTGIAQVARAASAPRSVRLAGDWPVDRTRIKPFPFDKMARSPLVVLRWVKVTQVFPGQVNAECVFDLSGVNMNVQTPTEFSFCGEARVGTVTYGASWGTAMSGLATPETAIRRVREWAISTTPTAKSKIIGHVSGRASAGNRWPLAFQIEPFDFAKVKVGQKLKFKSWPAPVPKS